MATPRTKQSDNGRKPVDEHRSYEHRLELEGKAGEEPFVSNLRESVRNVMNAAIEFAQVRADGIRVRAQSLAIKVVLALMTATAVTVFVVVSMVLLLTGLAGGVAQLLRAPPWLGYLIVGAVCAGVPVILILMHWKRIQKKWLGELRKKYDSDTE